jgi:hypothetical protein
LGSEPGRPRRPVAQLRLNREPLEPEAYAVASANPLAADSDQVVTHLLCAHPEQVVQLAQRCGSSNAGPRR